MAYVSYDTEHWRRLAAVRKTAIEIAGENYRKCGGRVFLAKRSSGEAAGPAVLEATEISKYCAEMVISINAKYHIVTKRAWRLSAYYISAR